MLRKHATAPGWPLLLCLICTQIQAQPVEERIIAVTESVGYEIDPAERQKYGLFDEYGGFLVAEVVSSAEQYFLRISYRRDKDRLVKRIPLAVDELQALR